MNDLTVRRAPRFIAVIACAVIVLVLLAACGGGDSKATATTAKSASTAAVAGAGSTTTAAATSATGAGAATATATKASSGTTPTTGTTSATATTAASDQATATTADAETPTEASADVSPTDASTDPLADVTSIDPNALPNFTLSFTLDSVGMGTDEESAGESKISMTVEQNAVDNYHLKIDSDGSVIESWLVDGKQYSDLGDGEVQELPEGTDAFFTPSTFLQTVPEINDTPGLKKQGEEKVNGRDTTRYHLDGKDAEAFFAASGDDTMAGITDPAGGFDVWIDNELKIQMKAHSDLTWKNSDGTPGSLKYDFEINQIGSTPKVAAPQ